MKLQTHLMNYTLRTFSILFAFILVSCDANKKTTPTMDSNTNKPVEPTGKVIKTDDEWRQTLSAEQYHILREAGTELPNGRAYKEFKQQGAGRYHCAGCGALLFSSKEKFDSGCGWPSFYEPASDENVGTREDISLDMVRTEVLCKNCGGHLGHVFEGEGFDTPTDKRYCINGGALRFASEQKKP